MIAKERIITRIIQDFKVESYLEIGLATGFNFAYQSLPKDKVGVDPDHSNLRLGHKDQLAAVEMTSDEYFEKKHKDRKFDLIFIDGLHEAEQVEKDIINAWYSLTANGIIILHDIHPPTEDHQEVPRKQESWTGDVWRAFLGFRLKYPKIPSGAIQEKYGLGWIAKVPRTQVKAGFTLGSEWDYVRLVQEIKANDALGYNESLKAQIVK